MTYGQVGGVSPGLIVGIGKSVMGSPKPCGIIKPSEPRKYPQNADGKWTNHMHVANPNPMGVNCQLFHHVKTYKKTFVGLDKG